MPEFTLIKNIRLIDAVSDVPITAHAILVKGERIERIAPEGEILEALDAPRDFSIVDGGGKTLVPGLINAHEHLTWRRTPGGWTERVVSRTPSWFIARGAGHCLMSIKEGVTSVRDVGAKDDSALTLRDAVDAGILVGPRIQSCRQTISMTGGHAYETSAVADGADEVRRVVREQILLGADFIKLMASGGAVAKNRDFPWSPQYTADELRAAFDEAHAGDRLTTVHCHPAEQIRIAVEAGVDCIEHGALIDEPTAELLAQRNVPLVPTLAAKESFLTVGAKYKRDPAAIERIRAGRAESMEKWRRIRETGVRLVAGVDSLGDLNLELSLFVEIGMSSREALFSATRFAAEAMGKLDDVGTLEAGKYADMVLLDADPLEDIDNLKRIAWVMKGGRTYDPATLTAAMGAHISEPV